MTNKESKHTATPWEVEVTKTCLNNTKAHIKEGERYITINIRTEDAERIVEAVNNHQRLQEENKVMREVLELLPTPKKNGNPDYVGMVGDDVLLKVHQLLKAIGGNDGK